MSTSRCRAEVRCWACTIQHEMRSRYGTGESIWVLYERAVEGIEAQSGVFTLADVYATTGGGPGMRSAITKAIRDMRLHGLVDCVDRVYAGRCLQWTLRRGSR